MTLWLFSINNYETQKKAKKKSLIFRRDNTGAFIKTSGETFYTEHTIISTYWTLKTAFKRLCLVSKENEAVSSFQTLF